jgi:hypothetical protein
MAKKNNQGESSRGGRADAGITKREAVQQALGELGRDAKPTQMQGWIRDRFAIDMTTDHISTSKGEILRKEGGKGRRKGKRRAARKRPTQKAARPQGQPAPTLATRGAGGKQAGIPLNDILYVKALVGRFGPEQLHTLIDAFAR